MKVILCLAALSVLCGAFGCSQEGSFTPTPPPTGFVMDMSLSLDRMYRGQNTDLSLEIANYGTDIELDFDCADHFGFRIENDDGELVYEYPSCYPNANHFTMRQGYKNRIVFSVPGGTLPVLEAGYYTISSGIMEHEDDYPWKEAEILILEPYK